MNFEIDNQKQEIFALIGKFALQERILDPTYKGFIDILELWNSIHDAVT